MLLKLGCVEPWAFISNSQGIRGKFLIEIVENWEQRSQCKTCQVQQWSLTFSGQGDEGKNYLSFEPSQISSEFNHNFTNYNLKRKKWHTFKGMDDYLRTSNQQQPHVAKVFTICIKYNIIKLLEYTKSLVRRNTILQSWLQVQETDLIMSFTMLYVCGRIQ